MHIYRLMFTVLGMLNAAPAMAAVDPDSADTTSTHTLTSNIGLVSNYVLRGIEQTSSNPAVQGGMDYLHSSGFYAGLWGSPVSWIADKKAVDTAQHGNPSTEVDLYFGHRGSFAADSGYNAGFIRYAYLGNYTAAAGYAMADSAEIYAALIYKFLSAKYSYSVLDQFMTIKDARGTNYIELNVSYTIPDTRYTLSAHLGQQTYAGATAEALEAKGTSASYADYRIAIARSISAYVLSVSHSNTNASSYYTHAKTIGGNWAGPVTALSLTHSF